MWYNLAMSDRRDFSLTGEFERQQAAWLNGVRAEAFRFGAESSGMAVPWIARHFVGRDIEARQEKRKRDDAEMTTAMLAQALQDLWDETLAILASVERSADELLARAESQLSEAEQVLEGLQARAERLEDGTRIYPDRDGTWRDETGAIVEFEEAGLLEEGQPGMPGMPGPTWEEFVAARDRRDAIEGTVRRIEGLQIDIGQTRHNAEEARENRGLRAMERARDQADELESEIDRISRDVEQTATPAIAPTQQGVGHGSRFIASTDLSGMSF